MSPTPIIDGHSDVIIDVVRRRAAGEHNVLARRHLPNWRAGKVGAAVLAVGGDAGVLCPLGLEHAYESAHANIDALEEDVAESSDAIRIVRSAQDVKAAWADGVFAVLLGFEGAMPIGGSIERLEEFHRRGLRILGLTWNSRNHLATGLGAGAGGLTPLGVRAVEVCNDLGLALDLAHASPQTFDDVLGRSRVPVLVSHANARALCDHVRNLDDEQLRALRDAGGTVGLVLYPDFVASGHRPPLIQDVLDHADYLFEALGVQGVCIGADFVDYGGPELFRELRPDIEPPEPPPFPVGLETTATLHLIPEGLRARGYASSIVAGVSSENLLGFLARVEAGAIAADS